MTARMIRLTLTKRVRAQVGNTTNIVAQANDNAIGKCNHVDLLAFLDKGCATMSDWLSMNKTDTDTRHARRIGLACHSILYLCTSQRNARLKTPSLGFDFALTEQAHECTPPRKHSSMPMSCNGKWTQASSHPKPRYVCWFPSSHKQYGN